MVDWLGCSTCFTQPGDGRFYYLTTCGHIFCEQCESKGWKEKCQMCDTNAPSTLKLTSKLPPQVQSLFADPMVAAKKIDTQLQQLVSSMEFQQSKRKRRNGHLQKTVTNQQTYIKKMEQYIKKLEQDKAQFRAHFETSKSEMARLKKESNYLKCILQEKSRGGGLRSPSNEWKSPGQKALVTSSSPMDRNQNAIDERYSASGQPTGSISSRLSSSYGSTHITTGRISVRTPPSGGKMGMIPKTTPSPYFNPKTPKSVPHPINFDDVDI